MGFFRHTLDIFLNRLQARKSGSSASRLALKHFPTCPTDASDAVRAELPTAYLVRCDSALYFDTHQEVLQDTSYVHRESERMYIPFYVVASIMAVRAVIDPVLSMGKHAI